MADENGNGTFFKWTAGVVGGLIILAVSGSIVFGVRVSNEVAKATQAIQGLESELDEAKARSQTELLRELHYRDQAISKVERRLEALEHRP
jgi:hypothetical protein